MSMTYVEEKSLFWKRKRGIEEEGNTLPSTSYPLRGRVASFPRRFLYVPDPPPLHPLQQYSAAMAAPQAAPHAGEGLGGLGSVASPSSLSSSVPDLRSLLVEEASASEYYNSNTPFRAPSLVHRNVIHPPSPRSQLRRMMLMQDTIAPKMTLRIHHHLADQHFFGSPSVDDEKGAMTAGKMYCTNESCLQFIAQHIFITTGNIPTPPHTHTCR